MPSDIMSDLAVTVQCDSGNGYDGRLGVRISSIFVIGLGSMLGMSESALLVTFFSIALADLWIQVLCCQLWLPDRKRCEYLHWPSSSPNTLDQESS